MNANDPFSGVPDFLTPKPPADMPEAQATGDGSGAPSRAANFAGAQQALVSRARSACIALSAFSQASVC